MRILVACEYSRRTASAFEKLGHYALSCDLLPADEPGEHYQGDVFDVINDGFDLMIAHPPCTFLTCSAEWCYKDRDQQKKKLDPDKLYGAERREAREEAIEFVVALANANIPRIAIENPVGVLSSRWRKPDQFIQPYEYGDDASKRTCLWLKNLPPLKPTKFIEPRYVCKCGHSFEYDLGKYGCPDCCGDSGPALMRWGNQTDSGQNREPPGADRWKIRSTTWQGWADAFADQWGGLPPIR